MRARPAGLELPLRRQRSGKFLRLSALEAENGFSADSENLLQISKAGVFCLSPLQIPGGQDQLSVTGTAAHSCRKHF